MSQLSVNAIDKESGSTLTLGGSGTTVNIGASGQTTNVTGKLDASNADFVPKNPLSNRNIIINGAMKVAQRGTDVAWASNGYLALDRFSTTNSNTAGRFSMKQTADGPSGFANCLEIDVTTADTSIAANEHMLVGYKFEGQDLQQIAKGTADAKQITISFYAKGNGNATYMCELFDRDNTRLIQQQFSVTSSWNRVELTFAADTTGAFDDDNLHSLDVQFWLHAGSDFTSGTYTANTWGSQVNANRAVGISSIYSSTSNYFRITGLQMEVGSVATPFEHESYGQTLQKCLRYFYRMNGGTIHDQVTGAQQNGNSFITTNFPVEMRATPTLSDSNISQSYLLYGGTTFGYFTTHSSLQFSSTKNFTTYASASFANGSALFGRLYATGSYRQFDAEL